MEPTKTNTEILSNATLVVGDSLENIDGDFFYKIYLKKENTSTSRERELSLYDDDSLHYITDEVKYILVSINDFILAPRLEIRVNGKIEYAKILALDSCLRFDQGVDYIKLPELSLIFDDTFSSLNRDFSGSVMDIVELNKLSINRNYSDMVYGFQGIYHKVYEVRLDNYIHFNESIYKKIYVLSAELLKGYKLTGIKINPLSLFNNLLDKSKKPVVCSIIIDKSNLIVESDFIFFKKTLSYVKIPRKVGLIMKTLFPITILIYFQSLFAGWEYFIVFISLALIPIWFNDSKVSKILDFSLTRKDDLLKVRKMVRIPTLLIGIIIFVSSIFFISLIQSYDSDYIYDIRTEGFTKGSVKLIDINEIFDSKAAANRYIPVKNTCSATMFYEENDDIVTSSKKIARLDLTLSLAPGLYLLDENKCDGFTTSVEKYQNVLKPSTLGNIDTINIQAIKEEIKTSFLENSGFTSDDILEYSVTGERVMLK